jgi:hypothetical protein
MRILRRYCHARGTRCGSGLCPASIRPWSEVRRATLATNSEQGSRWNTTGTMGGFGDCERRAASPQAVRETPTKTNPERVSSRFRRDSTRAIPKREKGTGADHNLSSPVPQKNAERLAAALRSGALTGRARARKGPPAMFGMPLSAPAGATLSERRSASRKELSSIVQLNKTAFSLRPSQSTLRTASSFLTRLDPVPLFGLLAHHRQCVIDCAKCRIRRVDQAREKPASSW